MAPLQPMGIRAVAEGVGKFNSKVDSMNKSIDKTNKATAKAEKSGMSFSTMLGKLGVAAGVATGAFIAIQKALAFGRQGALITQTSESFGFLIEKIGAAPDLLKQLQEASKGTITDLELMSSTATLLAGAGDKLAVSLADATPKLMEIAKAANKLNPNLGTTAFMYQSIATGVKRAQPLILDNLGITIKVGEANKAFAKSIGKTVDQLTAEEKAMAILAGTLEAGDNLIQQVGGNTDSATDSFDQAAVAITQAGDAIKKKLAPFLADAATGISVFLTGGDKIIESLGEQEQRILFTAESWEEYNAEIERISRTAGFARDHFGGLTSELDFLIASFTDSEAPTRKFANAIGAVEAEASGVAEANRNIVLSLTELTEATLAAEGIKKLNKAFADGKISEEDYKTAFSDVLGPMAGLEQPAIAGQLALFDLNQEYADGTIDLQGYIKEIERLAKFDGKVYTTTHVIDVVQRRQQLDELEGFQHGGQFMVGGKPGIDQNLVAFRATRGEVVTVTPTSSVDNRSVNMGNVTIGEGGYSPQQFDRSMRDWLGD